MLKPDAEVVAHLQEVLGVDEAIARLLAQREINDFEQAKEFFRPSLDNLHDPFLMKDMDRAVQRILEAVSRNEKIMIYGDYDVDGTTSVALVASYLRTFYGNFLVYIPDRYDEGYGISFKGIDFAKIQGVSLIIALDCGIKATDKIHYASGKDIDFIICDHHRPGPEIPEAVAVLDPKREDCFYPFQELCGCGVGFKLIQALHQRRQQSFESLLPYLDLVATAIGADIVPITGENRIFAYHGLRVLNQAPRAGFRAIMELTKSQNLTLTDVIFIIAPRINAAGRMKHGLHAVHLLMSEEIGEAQAMAAEIELFNKGRRKADKDITIQALAQIEQRKEQNRHTTVVYQENWHKGVIGIVASRLTETYYRPTLVFTKSGKKLAASARSVKGFDVYDALEGCSEYLEQFGGHKYAAGLTLLEVQFEKFKKKFEEVVAATIDKDLLVREVKVDLELRLSQINPKFYRILRQFAPCGPGNTAPVFVARNVRDTGFAKCVGGEGSHLKARLRQSEEGPGFDAIGFNLGEKCQLLRGNSAVDIAFSIEENIFRGTSRIQLVLQDVIPATRSGTSYNK